MITMDLGHTTELFLSLGHDFSQLNYAFTYAALHMVWSQPFFQHLWHIEQDVSFWFPYRFQDGGTRLVMFWLWDLQELC